MQRNFFYVKGFRCMVTLKKKVTCVSCFPHGVKLLIAPAKNIGLKYMSHDIINELIAIMGNTVLREILSKIRGLAPGWYAVIGDEATDVQQTIECFDQIHG